MKKAIIFVLIVVIIGVIFLSISTIFQNDDFEEELGNEGEQIVEPQGRNFSIELDEKMGFTAP